MNKQTREQLIKEILNDKKQEKTQKPKKQRIKRTKYYGVIFKAGREVTKIKINPRDRVFDYGSLSYNVNYEAPSIKIKTIFRTKHYFFYHLEHPDPLVINETEFKKDTFNSDIYNSMLKTKVTKDINDLAFNKFEGLLTMRNLIIALVIIGAIIYFSQGGTVTP